MGCPPRQPRCKHWGVPVSLQGAFGAPGRLPGWRLVGLNRAGQPVSHLFLVSGEEHSFGNLDSLTRPPIKGHRSAGRF